jgi:hypothetical protein
MEIFKANQQWVVGQFQFVRNIIASVKFRPLAYFGIIIGCILFGFLPTSMETSRGVVSSDPFVAENPSAFRASARVCAARLRQADDEFIEIVVLIAGLLIFASVWSSGSPNRFFLFRPFRGKRHTGRVLHD